MKQTPDNQKDRGNASRLPIWITVGVAAGIGVGVAIDNIALGVGIGLALGAIGGILFQRDRKSKSNDNKGFE